MMSRSKFLLIVALLIALVGWFRYFQEHSSGVTMNTEISTLQQRYAVAEGQLEDRQSEIHKLQQRLEMLRPRGDELDGALKATTGETAVVTMATDLASAADETLRAALSAAESEIKTLKARNEKMESLLSGQQGDSNPATEQLAVARSEVNNSTQQLADAISERERLEVALVEAQNKSELTIALERQLAAADQKISAHTNALQNEKLRVEALEQKLTDLNQGREMLESDINAKQTQLSKLSAEQEQAKDQIERLKRDMEQISKQKLLEVQSLQDQVTLIRMGSDIVFELGSTNLNQSGREVLERVAEYAERMPDRIISLEGHTDDVPIGKSRKAIFPSNWELSAARAASAVRYLEGLGVEPRRLRIIGYGANQPVGRNNSEQGRRSNRRLEIRLVPEKVFEATAE